MNKKLFPECHLSLAIHERVTKFSCSGTKNCMIGKCSDCSSTKLSTDSVNIRFTSGSDLTSPSDVSDVGGEDKNVGEDSISYYEWESCGKSSLKQVSTSLFVR